MRLRAHELDSLVQRANLHFQSTKEISTHSNDNTAQKRIVKTQINKIQLVTVHCRDLGRYFLASATADSKTTQVRIARKPKLRAKRGITFALHPPDGAHLRSAFFLQLFGDKDNELRTAG